MDTVIAGKAGVKSGKGNRALIARKISRGLITTFFVAYSLITLFPFYVLFIRTFVSTKHSVELHFWLPPETPISMDAGIGNLSVFYNLDIAQFKEAMGIKGYISSTTTLIEIAEKYDIPPDRIQKFFQPYDRYNGWIALFTGSMGSEVRAAAGRTLVVTVCSLVGMNLLGILTGFGLAGLRSRYHRIIYNLYLLELVIPGIMILLPQFMIVQWVINLFPGTSETGMARNIAQLMALILLNIKGGALSVMVFTSAIAAIPGDLEDAAEVDGASRLQYLFRVVLPLMKVPIASMTVITLPGFWNEFLLPYIYLDPGNTLLMPIIQNFTGKYSTNFQIIYTAIFASVLPLFIVYIVFRRLFIQGVMSGAVKG
jgi:ABC-type glycerol-3-phosphate transport system permease component